VIELLLREWDAERRITRLSKYAQFDARRKVAFLAAMAYEITYRIKVKTFSRDELGRAYAAVRDRFDLPDDEVEQVVQELETHTGLIAYAGESRYEFSHLSLQEYLCADYLVRDQFASNLILYLHEYPSPVAVAVSLSSNPSAWFAALILRFSHYLQPVSVQAFAARLLVERPLFAVFEGMGYAFIKLYSEIAAHDHIVRLLGEFVRLPVVAESIHRALMCFRVRADGQSEEGFVELERMPSVAVGTDFPVPERGSLPRDVLEQVRSRTWMSPKP